MKKEYLAVAILSSLLGACAHQYYPVPLETVRPATHQLDMQAAAHWNRLAEQVASNIQTNLPGYNNQHSVPVASSEPIFAPMPQEAPPAQGSDPLSNLPPGTLPPPGAVPEPVLDLQPISIVELDLDAPDLGISTPTSSMGSMSAMRGGLSTLSSTPSPSMVTRPVLYINPPRGGFETPFAMSFHDLLRAHLIQKGVAVSTQPDRTETFCSDASFCKPLLLDYRVDLVQHKDRWHVYEPNTEVIISTAVSDGDLVVFSRSDIYYINAGDSDHYHRSTRNIKVVDQ